MNQVVKKGVLSVMVILLFAFFLSHPFKKKSQLLETESPKKIENHVGRNELKEGEFYFNGEFSKYKKMMTSILPASQLEQFQLIARQNGIVKIEEKVVQGRVVAWYQDRSGKTHGMMSWKLENGQYVHYEIESFGKNVVKNTRDKFLLSNEFQLVMSADEAEKEVYLYESGLGLDEMHKMVKKSLKSMGFEDQDELLKHKKLKNFAYFSHEKENCFVQYQLGKPFNSLSIVFQKKE